MHTIILIMNKRWIFGLMLVAVFISGCTDNNADSGIDAGNKTTVQIPTVTAAFPVSEPKTVYIEILGTMFNPLDLNVVNGTIVKWINKDSASYVLNVDGVQSQILNKRDSWNHTFNKTGIFEYYCSIHPTMPHGKIIVE